jgi:ferric iron reductase protein FhuF
MAPALVNRASSPAVNDALECARRCGPYFSAEAGRPNGPAWLPASALARPNGPPLSDQLARIHGETRTTDRRVLGAYFIHRYAWRIAGPVASVYLAADALPDVDPDAVFLDVADDPIGIAFAGRWSIVGDGPGARGTQEAGFSETLTAHFAPLIAALRERVPLGERTLWAIAADAFASAFVAAGEFLEREGEAVERVRGLILDVPGTAFRSGTDFFTVDVGGRSHTVVRRGSCCQSFRLDGELCSTCPRVPAAEQRRRAAREIGTQSNAAAATH